MERFWRKVDVRSDTECWLWLAGTNRKGYGQICIVGRRLYTHRLSWEIKNGPIPDGLKICHKCDTPPCVNPSHLFIGTDGDNVRDMCKKGRSKLQRHPKLIQGENHPLHKLTIAQVYEIRSSFDNGELIVDIATRYPFVTEGAVRHTANRVNWKSIPEK